MNKRGFTLIELLVVVAIISLLASVTLAAFTEGRARARDAQRFSDLRQISLALELYYQQTGEYPPDVAACDTSRGTGPGPCPTAGPTGDDWDDSQGLAAELEQEYIADTPIDPRNRDGNFYYYEPVAPGQTQFGVTCGSKTCAYILSAAFEVNQSAANPGCNSCNNSHNYCVAGGGAQFGETC